MAKRGTEASPEPHVSGQANKPLSRPAHALSYDDVTRELKANTSNGLSATDAEQRLGDYGRNELGENEGVQPLKIVVAQIANAMTMVSGKPPQNCSRVSA